MRKCFLNILFILCCYALSAQQTVQYTQFNFNRYGYNPAAAGTSFKSPYEVIIGTKRQWLDVTNAPKTNFFGLNYTFIPKRSYRKWHNIGCYVDQDASGVFANNSFLVSYTFHLLVSKRLIAAFGVFAGVRRFFIDLNSLNASDPAVMKSAGNVWVYPDIIPGFRLYNKKFFFDVSLRQITTPHQANSTKQIGLNSKIVPHLYSTIGYRHFFDNDFSLVPSINMHTTFTYLPEFTGSLMLNYSTRGGIGLSVTGKNFIGAVLQIRFLKNAVAGFAYEYSINKMRVAAPNTVEFMMGIVPIFGEKDRFGKSSNVAKCPILEF
jgi:type IX secretion system PorP/SprF family membrane protein